MISVHACEQRRSAKKAIGVCFSLRQRICPKWLMALAALVVRIHIPLTNTDAAATNTTRRFAEAVVLVAAARIGVSNPNGLAALSRQHDSCSFSPSLTDRLPFDL